MKVIYQIAVLVIVSVGLWLQQFRPLPQFDIPYWQNVYNHSQYCQPECSFEGNIDDPELYSLAGYNYINGGSPTSINFELQPLTKYLFGLSIVLFGNALPAQFIFALATLILVYLLAAKLNLGKLVSFVPVILLMIDPLFIDQLKRPFLDLSVTMWLLLYLLFLARAKYQLDWWWGGVALGALALSKSFSLGIIVAGLGFVVMNRSSFNFYIKSAFVALATYILGYMMFFVRGGNLIDFIALHIDILRFYKSYVPEYPKGEVFRLIFTGQWRTWWGDKGLVASPFYSLLWPLSTISVFLALTQKKFRQKLSIHLLWIFISLGFISLRLLFPRYLLPALPSLYIIFVYTLYHFYLFRKSL